jgi:hypothetical protein
MPNAVYAIFAYPFTLIVTLFLAALIWSHWVSGVLYICTDSVGILDIIPPFVHPVPGDAYLVPAWRVWLIWWVLLCTAFALPAIGIWFVWSREKNHDA